jgi:putative acetyltransferase
MPPPVDPVEPVIIRAERPGDAAAIDHVTVDAFLRVPRGSHTEQFIVNALRRAGALTLSLVAEHEGQIVGHVAISPVTISDDAPGWFGLGPVSVRPALQGFGIGTRLIQQALASLRGQGASGCVVVGEPAYYRRFGFSAQPQLVYPGVPPQYFQALAFDAPLPSGTVTYHVAFNATS